MFAKPLPQLPIPTLIAAAVIWGLCWYFLDHDAAFKLSVVYAVLAGFCLYLRPDYPVSKALLFLLLLCVLPLLVAEQIERLGLDEYQDSDTIVDLTWMVLSVFIGMYLLRRNHLTAMCIEASQANFFLIRTDHLYELIALTSMVLGFGFWVLGFGFWVLGFGFWVLGFGLLSLLYVFLQWQTDWQNKWLVALPLGGFSLLCWHVRRKQIEHYQATQSEGGE